MNAFISSSLGSSIIYFCTKIFGSNPAVAYLTNVSPFSVQSRIPSGDRIRRFCRASKQKPCPISNKKRCRLSRMDCSKSFSVTKARSFNPKNSKVTGVLITSLGCYRVACCWTKAERASLFLESPLRS